MSATTLRIHWNFAAAHPWRAVGRALLLLAAAGAGFLRPRKKTRARREIVSHGLLPCPRCAAPLAEIQAPGWLTYFECRECDSTWHFVPVGKKYQMVQGRTRRLEVAL